MIVCLCNSLRESDIHDAVARGAGHPANVHQCLGCHPVCGRCLPHLEEYFPETASDFPQK